MALTSAELNTFVGLFVIGLMFLLMGLSIRTGWIKRWWIIYSTPLTPIGWAYAALPVSPVFFLMSLIVFIPDIDTRRRVVVGLILFGFLPAVIISTAVRPRWLIPAWLRWLEDNHGDILPLLLEEARQMGGFRWEDQVSTQEGLEQWVVEVRRKNQL